jgi:hypothetical protein
MFEKLVILVAILMDYCGLVDRCLVNKENMLKLEAREDGNLIGMHGAVLTPL